MSKDFDWPNQDPGRYLSEAEKNALIGSETVFRITGAKKARDPFDKERTGAERGEWTVEIPEGDGTIEKVLAFGFGDVPTRDQLLLDMIDHFRERGNPIPAKLIENGRVKLLVPVG